MTKYKFCSMNFGYMECEYISTLNIVSEIEYSSKEEFLENFVQCLYKKYSEQYSDRIDYFCEFIMDCKFLGYNCQKLLIWESNEDIFSKVLVSKIDKDYLLEIEYSAEEYLIQSFYDSSTENVKKQINDWLKKDLRPEIT